MPYCPAGKAQIQGTIFEADIPHNGGGTGWLRTQAPVVGGKEFSIRFAIWDTGDMKYDSAILINNFQWIANAGTVDVGTGRVPAPR